MEDRAAFMAALRAVEITDAPRGPVKIDPYGNPTQNIYIRKVEKVGGELQNTVIHTYPGGQPVLDLRPRGVPQAARVLAGVPALPALLGARARSRRSGGPRGSPFSTPPSHDRMRR